MWEVGKNLPGLILLSSGPEPPGQNDFTAVNKLASNTSLFGHVYQVLGSSIGIARTLRFFKLLRSMKSIKKIKESVTGFSLVMGNGLTIIVCNCMTT